MEIDKSVYEKYDINRYIAGATLLSTKEAENLPHHLREYGGWYWLRSPGSEQCYAAVVYWFGSVGYRGNYAHCEDGRVRPALQLSNLGSSNIRVGDRFGFGGVGFEVIAENLAFCTGDIGCCAFRKNREADDANDYGKSDIKKFVDEWFNSTSNSCAED